MIKYFTYILHRFYIFFLKKKFYKKFVFANPDGQWTHLVLQETGSDCMAKIRHSPGERQKQTRSLGPTEVTVVWRETRPLTWASTWKDEDEESADSPDDTDDFTDIWDEDGDE